MSTYDSTRTAAAEAAEAARAVVVREAQERKLHLSDLVKVDGHAHVFRLIGLHADGAHLTDVIAFPRVDLRGIRLDKLTVAAGILA